MEGVRVRAICGLGSVMKNTLRGGGERGITILGGVTLYSNREMGRVSTKNETKENACMYRE